MSARGHVIAAVRWVWDPRVAVVSGVLLMAGSAAAMAVSWPPSRATVRPFLVGIGLILRGLALPAIRRHLRRRNVRARRCRPWRSDPRRGDHAARR